ncbi:MAG: hypothetical protein LUF86_01085 [Clostridiales bacterium]|nr:hypothetical protein [Clostridiales bacterium]
MLHFDVPPQKNKMRPRKAGLTLYATRMKIPRPDEATGRSNYKIIRLVFPKSEKSGQKEQRVTHNRIYELNTTRCMIIVARRRKFVKRIFADFSPGKTRLF